MTGRIILPLFVKKEDTFLPMPARRAIDSADRAFFVLEGFFINESNHFSENNALPSRQT